jgi:dihydrofolate reductase
MPRLRVHNFSISIGGGAATIQQHPRAGLMDDLHVVIAPVLLGGGERLFDHLGGGLDGYECVEFVSSPAAARVRLSRTTTT